MAKRNLRKKHPHLFRQNNETEANISNCLPKEKEMKETNKKRTHKEKSAETTDDLKSVKKEMVHILVAKKKRGYTNKQIAEVMGMSTQQVAAMAAWHSGKLAAKRK